MDKKVFIRDGFVPKLVDPKEKNITPLFYIDTIVKKVDGEKIVINRIRMVRSGIISIPEEIKGSTNQEENDKTIINYIQQCKFGLM